MMSCDVTALNLALVDIALSLQRNCDRNTKLHEQMQYLTCDINESHQ